MAWILVAYSVGIVAEASSASPAVIFPAVSAWVKIVSRIACCAVMVEPLMLPALMVVAAICRPSSSSPAAISPSETVTSLVESAPSAPTTIS